MQSEVNYLHFSSIPSTNTWALENLSILDPQKITCITASEQTAGRGQTFKKWISPSGKNLYATFCFYLDSPCPFLPNLAQILSISCCRALEKIGISVQIKWPNDILVHGEKIAGVLCEIARVKDLMGIALGIGVNINMEKDLLKEIDQPATSLLKETGSTYAIREFLSSLLSFFLEDLELLSSQGFTAFLPFYQEHLIPLEKNILLKQGSKVLSVVHQGISESGALLVTLPCGTQKEIYSKDLLFSSI